MPKNRFLRLLPILLSLTVVAVAVPSAAAAQNDCDGRPCIRIGTFNLDSLGVRGRTGGPELRDQAGVERLVQLAVDVLGIDVIVFQEVNTVLTEIDNNVELASTRQYDWLAAALDQRGYATYNGAGSANSIVVAWNEETVELLAQQTLLVRASFDLGGGCSAEDQPRPRALRLRSGQLDFLVVGVDLIAPDGAAVAARGACEDRIRAEQVDDLLGAIDQLDGVWGDPVFLAGDFGAKAGRGSLKELKKAGKFIQLTKKGQRQAGSGKVSSLQDPRLLGDHVMYRKKESRRIWVRKSTLIFDPSRAGADYADFVQDYSNHVPVVTELYTDGS